MHDTSALKLYLNDSLYMRGIQRRVQRDQRGSVKERMRLRVART